MEKGRLEAFSDGVLAIIITIMVLELKVDHVQNPGFSDLNRLIPVFVSYVLSYIYIGIYWNNHHHLLHTAERINGAILWANLYLLFWLSLVPFATNWLGRNQFAPAPTALYGFVLLMAAVAYWILQRVIIGEHGPDSLLAKAVGRDIKGNLSLLIYLTAIGLSFVSAAIACGMYLLVAIIWLVPDRRIERLIAKPKPA